MNDPIFKTAFHNSPAMQSVVRASDQTIIEVNDTFLTKLGFVREEVIGKTAPDLKFWVNPERLADFRYEVAAKGFTLGREIQLRARNGDILTVLLSTHRVNLDGIPHLVSAGVDITERKDAEARLLESERRLRESEARFSKAFQASPLIMSVAKLPDARLFEVNEAFVRFVGLPREQIVGRTPEELGLWARSEERQRFDKLLGRGRLVRDLEALMRVQNGQLRNTRVSAELLEINGEAHLLTFAVDVTDQIRAQQILQDAEARTRALYESISAAAMVHDEKGFLQVNSAAVKLFGAARMEDIVGLHPGQVSPPQQPDGESSFEKAQRHMARAIAEGTHRFEWVCRKLNGADFPVEVTLTTLELEGRQVMQAVVLDLTERKRAEVELQNALDKERELNQLKSDFVSLVSHEFRTPLEVIMSSADNLDRYHDRLTPEKREQLLRTINKSVRRMSGMMEEVLVLGRLETDRMTFKPAAFDLGSFCQRMRDEIEAATAKRCPIQLELNNALPQAFGDENVLRHIFTNLLSNAVKYSPPDQAIALRAHRLGQDAIFEIQDHGCGIPEADRKRLFQAFHRGSNVRQIPGTGLGLLIVQRCVELHGGEIQFESVEGKGTTFTVKLRLFP